MAKDPAFLFYPNDYIGGTMGMTFEEKGAYVELLVLQFNKGSFTLEQAKKCLNGSFEMVWPELKVKFCEIEGKFFNERLEKEKNRRQDFVEKQKVNGKKGGRKPNINPTLNPSNNNGLTNIENENEIGNRKEEGGMGEEEKIFPAKSDIGQDLSGEDMNMTVVYLEATCSEAFKDQSVKSRWLVHAEILRMWKGFQIQYFTGEKSYNGWTEVRQHFRDWLKNQVIKSSSRASPYPREKPPAKNLISEIYEARQSQLR